MGGVATRAPPTADGSMGVVNPMSIVTSSDGTVWSLGLTLATANGG